jgi:hypothetical protein
MTKTGPKPRLSREDTRAMARAIDLVRSEDRHHREQIDGMLTSEPWEDVGRFAAYAAQDRSLRLKPWEVCPCNVHDLEAALAAPPEDHRGFRRAAELLQRLLAAGLSRFEPNPLAALAGEGNQ